VTLLEAALAAGATQLGEEPHPHFIFDEEQLVAFVAFVALLAEEGARDLLPPLPY
jgi:hypothetical protein